MWGCSASCRAIEEILEYLLPIAEDPLQGGSYIKRVKEVSGGSDHCYRQRIMYLVE